MSDYSLEPPTSIALTREASPTLVTVMSPQWKREMVDVLARYAKKERGFDLPPFDTSERPGHGEFYPYEVHLFHRLAHDLIEEDQHTPSRAIGAVCFRNIGTAEELRWTLQWAWFHPFARARGLLSDHWPELRRKYGRFTVERPLSSSMKAFLTRHGDLIPPE